MQLTAQQILELPSEGTVNISTQQLQQLLRTVHAIHEHNKTLNNRLAIATRRCDKYVDEVTELQDYIKQLKDVTIGIKCISAIDMSDMLKA